MEEPKIVRHSNYKFLNYGTFAILDSRYAPHFRYDVHHDGPARISILIQGKLSEKVCSHDEYASTGSIVYKPEGVEHSNRFGPKGARLISIILPKEYLHHSLSGNYPQEWDWFHQPKYAAEGIRFLNVLNTSIRRNEVEENITELVAHLFKPAQLLSKVPPPWLKEITDCIETEYGQNLRVKDLADSVQVHPVYLARVFRHQFGCSVKEYIHNIRMRRALDALSAGKHSIAEIAYDCGFADQSHLNRVFRSKVGSTPGRFNQLLNTILQ